ncbi:MAG: ABC transporter substrate-binding protein [Clostridiales bacterium]|nr:ABC transporter substrate-binding protein [Clostridiales bacterium]
MKKITKTLTLLALSLCLMLSLIGCGGAPADGAVDEKLTVGVVQLIDNGAFEDMREGFIARLQELGYTEDKCEIYYKNAQGDAANLNAICQEMVDKDVDLIAAIATPAAQAAVNLQSDIPVVFISVSNPTGAGIITDMAHPDKNATGTSNAIPVSEMFKLADRLTPGCQTYGLLYTTGEINAVTTINDAKAYMDANGIKYVEKVVSNSSEVQQAAQSLVGSVDAIFCPNDSVVQAAMPQIAQIAREAKIPVYGSSAVMVNSGAFATISISDTEIGAISADMADQILKGTPVSEVPAKVVDVFTTVINQNTADAIGASLSDDVKANAVLVEDSAQ